MSRHVFKAMAAAIALAISAVGAAASAQERVSGWALNHFEPSERGSEWFVGESLDLRGGFRPAIGAVGDYSYRSLVTYRRGDIDHSVVRNDFFIHVGGSLVLFDRLRLAVSLPLQLYADGNQGGNPDRIRGADPAIASGRAFYAPEHDQGIGDLRLGADLRLFGVYGEPFTVAIGGQVWAPTGDRDQYTSDGPHQWRTRGRLLFAGDLGPIAYSLQGNATYRPRDRVGDIKGEIGSTVGVVATLGVRTTLFNNPLVIGPEFWGETVINGSRPSKTNFVYAFDRVQTPAEVLLGLHYTVFDNFRIGAGAGTGLTRGYGAPQFRGLLSLEWTPAAHVDTDGDGIDDKVDACPKEPGVLTHDPATNGCPLAPPPPPADRDGDGIPDSEDACPDTAGVSGAASINGCPADSDGDSVPDKDDACPQVAGLKTGDPLTNGCPDPDRDKDGVPNEQDACPDEPGKVSNIATKNGCPQAFVSQGQIRILDQVKFRTAKAEIERGESEETLTAVQKILTDHPEIKHVRVEGYTDSSGRLELNKKLSASRAAAVAKWLVKHGIDKSRLESVGLGPESPIDTNETAEGRAANRRVEFHIVETDAPKPE